MTDAPASLYMSAARADFDRGQRAAPRSRRSRAPAAPPPLFGRWHVAATGRSLVERALIQAWTACGLPDAPMNAAAPASAVESINRRLDTAAQISGDRDVAIRLALHTTLTGGAPLLYLLLSSATLGDALTHAARHVPAALQLPLTIALQTTNAGTMLRFHVESARPRFVEYVAAFTIRVARALTGDSALAPIAMTFAHAPTRSHARDLAVDVFGPAVAYDGAFAACTFSAEQLGLPLLLASPALHALHGEALHRSLAASAEDDLVRRVRVHVERELAVGVPTLAALARTLGASVRTVQRRLREQGTHYQALVDDIRRQRVLDLICERSVSVDSLAHAVGYRDARVLHRAFRQWTGMTPGDYRRRLARQ